MRKRRDDAEAEREEMDRLKAEESRLREQQQYGDWQKKEEHFHLKQATQRSKVSRSLPPRVKAWGIGGGQCCNQMRTCPAQIQAIM